MSEKSIKIGTRVEVLGKNVQGVVAYVGATTFSSGKWVGVVLDESKGKNNGTVQGKSYFHCKENHGIFVRQSQLSAVGGSGEGMDSSMSSSHETPRSTPRSTPASTPATTPGTEERRGSRLGNIKASSAMDISAKEDEKGKKTPSSTSSSKRSSFIETNFVETVSYTPNVSSLDERVSVLQQLQENDELKNEVKDLQEKLETLRGKRAQDKDKLKEFEKTKIQLQQLQEFKTKIMESQSELQRELQKAKQEAKAAIEAREQHAEEMADFAEAVEMTTLDREMAEEKCESIQAELEQTKEKLEEVTMDLEILQNEISSKGTDSAATDYKTKQLEQQNERLKDALVNIRDIAAEDKQMYQRSQKEIDRQKSEIAELSRIKEKLSSQIDTYEKQMSDLKEQVDAALGAEEMVEKLAERNLNLEEDINKLRDTVNDLEALHDMNEELQENARETEVELREEIDFANARCREMQQKLEASHETTVDFEQTIFRFRELTESMKDRNRELVEQLEKVTDKVIAAPKDLYDFKIKFSETKAHAKAVEMELRRLEVEQANEHIKYLCAFMPESFLSSGGDHDGVLILLLIPRLVWKTEILMNQLREKYAAPEAVTMETVIKGHTVEQYGFCTHFMFILKSLQTLLHQYISILNGCSVEVFVKVGSLYPEIAVQEKAVDFYLDLLKKDQLDENVILEPIEKGLSYFHHLYGVYLNNERVDCTTLMIDHATLLILACDSIGTELERLKILLQPGQESSDMYILLKELGSCNDDIRQIAKKIRRHLHQDRGPNPISFENEVQAQLMECNFHIGRVVRTLRDIGQAALQQVLVTESKVGLGHEKLKELSHLATDKIYGTDDSGPIECLKQSMVTVIESMQKISRRVLDGEFDFDGTPEPLPPMPLIQRSQAIKNELKDVENLKAKLDSKEKDFVETKLLLKLKLEEISEMSVRKDLLEKKLDTVLKEADSTQQELTTKLTDTTRQLREKEKEFEKSMDHLQADIDALEMERGELKEKLKVISKKALYESLAKTTSLSPTSPVMSSNFTAPTKDSSLLVNQISDLRMAIQHLQNENALLQSQLLKNRLSKLPPLKIGSKPTGIEHPTGLPSEYLPGENEVLSDLSKKTVKLLKEVKSVSVNPMVVDISNRKAGVQQSLEKSTPAHHLVNEANRMNKLKDQADTLQCEINKFLIGYHRGGKATSDFSEFPTPQFTKTLQEHVEGLQWIGRITIPQPKGAGKQTVPVVLDAHGLKHLHTLLSH